MKKVLARIVWFWFKKQVCISFIRDDKRVFLTFNQDKRKWFIDCQKIVIDKRGMRAKCGIIEDRCGENDLRR